MTELLNLTLAEARDGLRAKQFSATELAKAHVVAVEKGRLLNAYVLETPEKALAMAAESEKRIVAKTRDRAAYCLHDLPRHRPQLRWR